MESAIYLCKIEWLFSFTRMKNGFFLLQEQTADQMRKTEIIKLDFNDVWRIQYSIERNC